MQTAREENETATRDFLAAQNSAHYACCTASAVSNNERRRCDEKSTSSKTASRNGSGKGENIVSLYVKRNEREHWQVVTLMVLA